mmetsp:Transcript_12697/g.29821  ORF Transcript_12697/g.29821 Transcript_12697/m.29821 type:complete len:244 (-) Transcript_12697:559-1290(-)
MLASFCMLASSSAASAAASSTTSSVACFLRGTRRGAFLANNDRRLSCSSGSTTGSCSIVSGRLLFADSNSSSSSRRARGRGLLLPRALVAPLCPFFRRVPLDVPSEASSGLDFASFAPTAGARDSASDGASLALLNVRSSSGDFDCSLSDTFSSDSATDGDLDFTSATFDVGSAGTEGARCIDATAPGALSDANSTSVTVSESGSSPMVGGGWLTARRAAPSGTSSICDVFSAACAAAAAACV